MKPKPIWKPFLNTGIRFFLCSILLLISCSTELVHHEFYIEYVLKNQTDLQLKISAIYFFSFEDRTPEYISTYKIESKDSLTQERGRSYISFHRFMAADSVVVRFGNKKSISFTPGDRSKYNILDLPNYSKDSISENKQSYTYTFTEADYNNATPLVFGEDFIGSVWRCTEGEGLQEGLEYTEFRIISETQLQGWAKWEEEPSPELYFTADYRIEGESLLITDQGETLTAILTDDYTGLITNRNEEGECVFYKR